MNLNKNNKIANWPVEKKVLAILSLVFVVVVLGAWGYAMKLRQTVAANNAVTHVDPDALIEVERIRNIAESHIANSRSYFLLGAQSIYEKQKKDKEALNEALVNFEKQHPLPQIPPIIKHIQDLGKKTDDFFDQAMEFREKKMESKIVGQFYQSKTNPIRTDINEALDEIVSLHKEELNRSRAQAREAALKADVQIPQGMSWFTASIVLLFLAMAYLVIRMSRNHAFQLEERTRLFEATKKAVQDRDETIFAISHDLKDSLKVIASTAEQLATTPERLNVTESGELVKSTVVMIEGIIQDIRDQKSVEAEGITLRLDQRSIDDVLEEARLLMQPMAKKKDIRIQVDTVNPPVLAFYDQERVLRVLSNLISNAIKFSPKGSKIVVKARSDQKFVNISVVDTGSGIPSEKIPGLFENFWQARKTADQGAGVGLAIVKTIVEAHAGTVQVQSQVGRGTTVTFSLSRRRPIGAPMKKSTLTIKNSATQLPINNLDN